VSFIVQNVSKQIVIAVTDEFSRYFNISNTYVAIQQLEALGEHKPPPIY